MTADYENGLISEKQFYDIDRQQGINVADTVSTFVGAGEAAAAAKALRAATISDVVRWGPTVVSNQILRGKGAVGADIRWTIKGGGGPFSWKYHIGSYNWYKTWTWFKKTPIIKS
ncbi:hypothetical protein PYV00_08870 [Novosphingobium sp. H3SJ31-1]|uniref:Uncharacterized protein n=1 Tax=Novosphingobium album (ex Liu et al. 2023) TaxID=3031130 RepID=A0ABT5WP57_9SPHN|nr:hypothetical protein [Novosphingobium album (ex Liu et al. 2023)]